MHAWAKRMVAAVCAAGMMLAVAGCGEHDDRTQISVWSWEPSMAALIADFEARNPDVHVTQIGTADYSKLNSAIQDGYGTPDVVQLEYFALPQYAVSGQLRDLTSRTTNYGSFYTPGSWSSVQLDGRVYGVPMDSGPMAFFYNQDVFEQAGVDAAKIRTWDDYYRAAKKLKENGVYIAADDGDASFYNAMIWLAGGRPYNTSHDGKEVSITLDTDTGTQEFTRFWQQMIDEDLVNTRLDTGARIGHCGVTVRRRMDAVAAAGRRARHRRPVARGADAHGAWQPDERRKRRVGARRAQFEPPPGGLMAVHRICVPRDGGHHDARGRRGVPG